MALKQNTIENANTKANASLKQRKLESQKVMAKTNLNNPKAFPSATLFSPWMDDSLQNFLSEFKNEFGLLFAILRRGCSSFEIMLAFCRLTTDKKENSKSEITEMPPMRLRKPPIEASSWEEPKVLYRTSEWKKSLSKPTAIEEHSMKSKLEFSAVSV